MWIFTQNGFLSVVLDAMHPSRLLVRSRVREDIEYFVEHCGWPGVQIDVNLERDYRYRCSVPREIVRRFVSEAVREIDYTNFKDRVHQIDDSVERTLAYTRVWQHMRDYQELYPAPRKQKRKKGSAKKRKAGKSNIRQWKA